MLSMHSSTLVRHPRMWLYGINDHFTHALVETLTETAVAWNSRGIVTSDTTFIVKY